MAGPVEDLVLNDVQLSHRVDCAVVPQCKKTMVSLAVFMGDPKTVTEVLPVRGILAGVIEDTVAMFAETAFTNEETWSAAVTRTERP